MIRKVSSNFMPVAFKGGDSPTQPPKPVQVVFLPFKDGFDNPALRNLGKPPVTPTRSAPVLAAAERIAALHLHPEAATRYIYALLSMA